MPDEFDLAQGHNEDFQAFALCHQLRSRELNNYSGTDCVVCGEEIPVQRRQARPGCLRCIECQETFEMEAR